MANSELARQVYEFLLTIPKGKVVTYGIIGVYLGNKYLARAVGNILHKNPHPELYPCYKVVSASGALAPNFAFGGADVQRTLLQAEGIEVVDDKVDLNKYLIESF